MPPAQPFKRTELPYTAARQKWAAKIKTGPDLQDILGFTQSATDLTVAAFSQLLASQMQDVASVETLEIVQSKTTLERYAFGPDPLQPFQVIPLQVSVNLRLTKIALKALSTAEKVFNFFPSNLVNQQLPFVIYVQDVGQPGTPNTAVEHYFFGCWFVDSNIKYDVTDRSDTRLIQNATVKAGRMVTLDPSNAGSLTGAVLQNVFSGILAEGENQNLLDDLELT